MSIHLWLSEPLPNEVALALERLVRTEDVAHVAVMPDVHLAEDVCIGTVVATRSRLFPSAVGGDIGCGIAAIRFECEADVLRSERVAARLLAGLYQRVPTLKHPERPQLPQELEETPLSELSLQRLKQREGTYEFATLGSGNHFIELQSDEEGWLWLMLHSGSRAMGQAIRKHHTSQAVDASGMRFIEAESPAGLAYLSDVEWALAYADESRRAMVMAIVELVGEVLGIDADEQSYLACHHNHVRREEHFGESLWVHRKGAIPAREGESGIVPGSMGTLSYHVEGRGHAEALTSTSHGAGRAMSRSEARRRISTRTFEREVRGVWFDHRIADQLRDEAPSAYKDVRGVMQAQRELTRIVRTLRPLLSYKGA